MMKVRLSFWGILILLVIPNTAIWAQCISDECGDIFADWALVSTQTTVCEGATFEVINQTTMDDIAFYVWDWGNGERDTVFEVSNYFYTYNFGPDEVCSTGTDFIVYNISLEIYRFCDPDQQSCHTQIAPVAVRFAPRAVFQPPAVVCEDEPFTLNNMSCAGLDFFWDFGDGNTSTDENPDHEFDSTGVYDVTLVVNNTCGSDTVTYQVEVTGQPQAEAAVASGSTLSGCMPLTVEFEDNSRNADYYIWTLPDGGGYEFLDTTNENSAAPIIRFNDPGLYEITLTVGNDCDESEWISTVEVLAPPEANLFPVPAACEFLLVDFADYFSYQGNVDSFDWEVTGPNPIVIDDVAAPTAYFGAPGAYTVYVNMYSEACGTDLDSTTVLIQAPEVPELMAPPLNPICNSSDPVLFTALPADGYWMGNGIDSSGMFDPSQSGPGNFILTYTYDNEACEVSDTLSVNVTEAVSVTSQDGFTICESGDPLELSFTPFGGTWSGPGIIDPANGIFDPTLSGNGDFTLIYTFVDSNQCEIVSETPAEVAAQPDLTIGDTTLFCIDALNINLNAELMPSYDVPGGFLTWSGVGITDSLQGIFNSMSAGANGLGIYPVYLTYAATFCEVTDTVYISIADPDFAAAGEDQSVCIQDGIVQLIGSPSGGIWSGPGLVNATEGLVDPQWAGGGQHDYVYVIAGGSSCEVSDTITLDVVDLTSLDAGPDLSVCIGETGFSLPTPGQAGGLWSGPGVQDEQTGQIDLSQLAADSSYYFYYTLTDAVTACSFMDSLRLTINPQPVTNFELPEFACISDVISFNATGDGICNYEWQFGNGQSGIGQTSSTSYASAGTYTVTLTVRSCPDCITTISRELIIADQPEAALNLDVPSGCGPLTVNFANQSTGNSLNFNWDFGNGQTSTQANPTTTFASGVFDTLYPIRLVAENACGSAMAFDTVLVRTVPVANFGANVDDGCSPLTVSFANTTLGNADDFYWDFGNGQTSQDSLPPDQVFFAGDSSLRVYQVQLIAENFCGFDTISRDIVVNPADVTPFIAVDTSSGCQPLTVNFGNFATFGANVAWDFGDGTTSGEENPSHTFENEGVFTVAQYVSSVCGADTGYVDITVLPAPEVFFSHDPQGCTGQIVEFVNESPSFQSLEWNFGDGQTSTQINPQHIFDSPGTYTVTLNLVAGNFQCPAVYQSQVTILPRPTVDLVAPPAQGCPPLDVCFNPESEAEFFDWDFADGNRSTDKDVCHRFTESGQYPVVLRALNGDGCYSDSITVNVMVYEEPEADFAPMDPLICGLPDTINFQNLSVGADSYSWLLGDDQFSTLTNPTRLFTTEGEQVVQLIASNAFQCQDTLEQSFFLSQAPIADFGPTTIVECSPVEIVFDNNSINADSYLWDFGNGVQSEELSPVLSFTEPGMYDLQLIVGYQDRCFDTLSMEGGIEILQSPTAAFSYEIPTSEYLGIVQFVNESTDAYAYEWNFGDGNTSEEENPLHDYQRNGNWETFLLAYAPNGCIDTAYVSLEDEVIATIHFPNAFSPESGVGDVRLFKPAGFGIAEWKLTIFTPWSELVYESEELDGDQPAAAWDGYYRGQILPQGAYAYKAAVTYLDGRRKVYIGSVTLLR